MDRETRNRIQRATQDARALLEREYAEQLDGTFDIRLDGTIADAPGDHLDARQRLVRSKLVAAVEHLRAGGGSNDDAVGAYLREAAFTTLNRFVALKMLEARGLVQECLSRGEESSGFKEFTGLAPGLVQLPDHGYRLYIECLFDEIGREVRVLFDRRDPASLLWPRRQALLDLLGVLTANELASVWGEDETIGWVYQYFNSDEERRQMRAESQAPRNSRELAVRNQFFTPRYVVEFLTDNTLGRIWYEMRQGQTRLCDLEFLVRRPKEVFLAEGEEPPSDADVGDEDLTQEELLQRPIRVPFRAKRDPRDIRVLDPACGSGHFLLYAFGLLLTVYEEAWADDESPASEATGRTLRDDYPEIETLRAGVPGLILRHNLHGIDIDARCAQIAALALWMRAQRAYKDLGIPRDARPPIQKTNIVVAEPMPGDPELRREFVGTLEPKLGKLVERVFDRMELAGEAGSLLRIEDDIRDIVREIFPAAPGDLLRPLDEDRWESAEGEVLQALRVYAERATNGRTFQRRLFAEDALRGLGFIDLAGQRYDVLVMNPPFGDASTPALYVLDSLLASSGRDIGAAFVRDAAERWCSGGRIGVLLSTAPWFKPAFEQWRADLFFGQQTQLHACAHFGGEVLDGATVNASPMVLSRRKVPVADVYRLTRSADLATELSNGIDAVREGHADANWYSVSPEDACALPGGPFSYWMSLRFLRRIRELPAFEGSGGTVKQGTATADEFRFARAWWEVPPTSRAWLPYVKTSPYSPFWDDVTWMGRFADGLREIEATGRARVQGIEYFGRAGVTYTSKSVLGFNPRLHPAGCGFGHTGSVAFGNDVHPLALLGFLGSRPVEYLLSLFIGELQGKAGVHPNHYEVGTIQRLPWPGLSETQHDELRAQASRAVSSLRRRDAIDEVTRSFLSPVIDADRGLRENAALAVSLERGAIELVCVARDQADRLVEEAYGFTERDVAEMNSAFAGRVPPASGKWRLYFGEAGTDADRESYTRDVISWAMGVGVGRWRTTALTDELLEDPNTLLSPPSLIPPGSAPAGGGKDVLVDDPGHGDDVAAAVRAGIEASWGGKTDDVLEEAAEIVGSRRTGIRGYLRAAFFEDHIKRYSKSRRKAPIYWQLATPSASYSVWLYYNCFTRDTLYRVLNDYVTPKLKHEERKLASLTRDAGPNPSVSQRKEIDAQEGFVAELRAFRDEVARVAPLWNPDLNDGVIINFAPLWRLVPQNRKWQKECQKTWDKLVAGEYDWAQLTMHLWPERAVPKCAKDRSLAIAHGLEDVFWEEQDDGKWQPRKVPRDVVDRLVEERTSAAVKSALEDLLRAPAPAKLSRGRHGAGRRRHSTSSRAAAPRSSRSNASPAATVDNATLEAVKQALAASRDGASKSDVLEATRISDADWNAAIRALLAEGAVVKSGAARGTLYYLAEKGGSA